MRDLAQTARHNPAVSPTIATDLEGTLTTGETWRCVRDFLRSHGRGAAFTRFFYLHLPGVLLSRLGLINSQRYRERWFEDVMKLLAGMSREQVDVLTAFIVDELWRARREDVLTELAMHRSSGARLIVTSGTYQFVAEAFAVRIGAEAIGTALEFGPDGKATGRLIGATNAGPVKAARLRDALGGEPLAAAYGDTEGDIPMLDMAQSPVAVYPDRRLGEHAARRGWRVLGAR